MRVKCRLKLIEKQNFVTKIDLLQIITIVTIDQFARSVNQINIIIILLMLPIRNRYNLKVSNPVIVPTLSN